MPTAAPALAAAHGPRPEGVPVTASVVERGQRWLEGKEEGTFPVIVAHYRDTVGFSAYVQGIRRLGGRFLIRDLDARQLTAEIDFEGESRGGIGRAGMT